MQQQTIKMMVKRLDTNYGEHKVIGSSVNITVWEYYWLNCLKLLRYTCVPAICTLSQCAMRVSLCVCQRSLVKGGNNVWNGINGTASKTSLTQFHLFNSSHCNEPVLPFKVTSATTGVCACAWGCVSGDSQNYGRMLSQLAFPRAVVLKIHSSIAEMSLRNVSVSCP